MEDKKLRIERLKAAQEKIDRKIKELEDAQLEDEFVLENEEEVEEAEDEEVINISEKKDSWKKVAAIAGVAAVAGTGVFLAVRQPWKAAKVVCHFVHIV